MGTSCSPGMAVNALPRSCAFALSSTEWQQALTASPAQRNLHRMAPTLGNMGPLKMNGSIYKNGLTSRVSSEPEEQRKQQRKSRERWGKRTRRTRWWKKKVLMGLKGNVETNRENERWCFFKSIWEHCILKSPLPTIPTQHNTIHRKDLSQRSSEKTLRVTCLASNRGLEIGKLSVSKLSAKS